jgi:metalloendopeptidase OMA1, mitochondrial
MAPRPRASTRLAGPVVLSLVCGLFVTPGGCARPGQPGDEGPGHRPQVLALSPEEELELGREAYREILAQTDVLPSEHPAVRRVRQVGGRLIAATRIRPLLREINLRDDGDRFEWEFQVIASDRVNAFCLPGGKVAVFGGLLRFVRNEDELASVMGHEMAHALAHHASERIAIHPEEVEALRASGGRLGNLDDAHRRSLIGLLDAGAALESLSYNRFQESEADHIGVFLMTFAGYEPEAALAFWERMSEMSAGSSRLPEILSDHPADARRIAQLREWVPLAEGAKRAYENGQIAPEAARSTRSRGPVEGALEIRTADGGRTARQRRNSPGGGSE